MGSIPRMRTIQQLSEETGISYYAIRKMCLEEKIKFIKTGRKYLINYEKFIDYLNGESEEMKKEIESVQLQGK